MGVEEQKMSQVRVDHNIHSLYPFSFQIKEIWSSNFDSNMINLKGHVLSKILWQFICSEVWIMVSQINDLCYI